MQRPHGANRQLVVEREDRVRTGSGGEQPSCRISTVTPPELGRAHHEFRGSLQPRGDQCLVIPGQAETGGRRPCRPRGADGRDTAPAQADQVLDRLPSRRSVVDRHVVSGASVDALAEQHQRRRVAAAADLPFTERDRRLDQPVHKLGANPLKDQALAVGAPFGLVDEKGETLPFGRALHAQSEFGEILGERRNRERDYARPSPRSDRADRFGR